MSINTLIIIFIIPAIVFAFAYNTLFTQYSRGLLSPYPKADVRKRLCAASIDGLMVVTTCFLYRTSDSVLSLSTGAAYLLFRDAIKGQSIGKFLLGLVVISLETGRTSSLTGSVRRNLLLLLPGANVVAIFLETRSFVQDPQGQRFGDRLAQTQVIEGLGAKELLKSFQDWLMDCFGADFGRSVEKEKSHTDGNQ